MKRMGIMQILDPRWKKVDGKTFIESLHPTYKVGWILGRIAQCDNYESAAQYFELFKSPETPSTVERVKDYLGTVNNMITRRILEGQTHIYGGISEEAIKSYWYPPLRIIFQKCKNKKVVSCDGRLGHAKMHPFLMELYELNENQKVEINRVDNPVQMQLVIDSRRKIDDIINQYREDLYLAINPEDARLLCGTNQLPGELNYIIKTIPISVEQKVRTEHPFDAKDLAPSVPKMQEVLPQAHQ